MEASDLFVALARFLDFGTAPIYALTGVFARVGAAIALLPGFGEQSLPMRVKLAAAICFTLIVWPAVAPTVIAAGGFDGALDVGRIAWVTLAEAGVGLMIGLAVRLLVLALQFAGSIAAQATAVAQIFGSGFTPDPMPAIGNMLVVAGIALALAAGLHVKAAAALIASYEVASFGVFPLGPDVAVWGVGRASAAFALALSLAGPFVIAAFAYNLALGAINRAMPQLMVAFVGAPAITAGALFLLMVSGPVALTVWTERVDMALAAPLSAP